MWQGRCRYQARIRKVVRTAVGDLVGEQRRLSRVSRHLECWSANQELGQLTPTPQHISELVFASTFITGQDSSLSGVAGQA